MYGRFGIALHDFASAVDIADDDLKERLEDLLEKYLVKELGFNFYEVLLEEWESTKNGPRRILGTRIVFKGGTFPHVPIGDGTTQQTTYSFFKDRPLWITARDRGLLKKRKNKYVDSWTKKPIPKFPQYKSGNGFDIRTSIIQPLKNEQGAFGVINVESEQHLVCNQWAKHELELIAKAVAAIVGQHLAHTAMRKGTSEADKQLERFVSTTRWNVMKKPKIFVAYSANAREDVVKFVLKAAEKLDDYELANWPEREGDGEARAQMVQDLRESRVIVCYLSEPAKSEVEPSEEDGADLPKGNAQERKGEIESTVSKSYVDNANVLFEAGIAQGLKEAWLDVTLIPIREEGSVEETPFYVDGLQYVRVPRTARGTLNVTEFRKRLDRQLK
jgi:hypothetical protein